MARLGLALTLLISMGTLAGCVGGGPVLAPTYEPEMGLIDERDTTYRVRARDTLYSLARRYGTSVRHLLELNPSISPRKLPVGSLLRVPGGKPPVRAIHTSYDRSVEVGIGVDRGGR